MTKKVILVENYDPLTMEMFAEAGYDLTHDPEEADLICFTGGRDVNPNLYFADPDPTTDSPNYKRDAECVALYNFAVANGLPCVGICRGAQFITVMQGGSLIQNVDQMHPAFHNVVMTEGPNENMIVSSGHHQAMLPHRTVQVIGKADDGIVEITHKERGGHGGPNELCVQGHPEWCKPEHEFRVWFLDAVKHMLDE